MADKPDAPDLDLPFHGLSDADLGTEFETGIFGGPARMPLKALLAHLRATYSSTIGAEFMHITDAPQRRWLYTRLERAAGKDRKSVVSGKSVSVRVDLGGRRIIKKKKKVITSTRPSQVN